MEKINGKVKDGNALNKVLGRKDNVAGIKTVIEYQSKISAMDRDELYRHGMTHYGIVPSRSKTARQTFEKRCVTAFRKETNQLQDQRLPQPKLKKKKKDALENVLKGVR